MPLFVSRYACLFARVLGVIMRLISLNMWSGKLLKPLLSFFKQHAKDTDVFCLQEVWAISSEPGKVGVGIPADMKENVFADIQKALPDFQGYFAPAETKGYGIHAFGIALFVKKSIKISKMGEIFVFGRKNAMVCGNEREEAMTIGRNLQFIDFVHDGKEFTIAHFHGLWNGKGKTDTPDRIEQSQKAKAFLDSKHGAKIICGDFNLLPHTKSIEILEKGMVNLIKTHAIKTTRSHHYKKPEKFADYMIVSPEVKVKHFEVLQDPVSDHLPLLLDFA